MERYVIDKYTFRVSRFLAGVISAILFGIIFGIIYTIAVVINPFIYINFLLAFIAGVLLVMSVNNIQRFFGTTSLLSAFFNGILSFVIFLWVYYSGWLMVEGYEPWASWAQIRTTDDAVRILQVPLSEPFRFSF